MSDLSEMIEVTEAKWLGVGYWEGLLGMALASGRRLQVVVPPDARGLLRTQVGVAEAVAQVCGGVWSGDVGGRVGVFEPSPLQGGAHRVRLGLGQGVGRVLAALVPAAGALPRGQSLTLTLEGSTHAPNTPTTDHWALAMPPLLASMGVSLTLTQARAGFAPPGGGEVEVVVEGGGWQPARWERRGALTERCARVWLAHLPEGVAARQVRAISQRLSWTEDAAEVLRADDAMSSGNALSLIVGDGQTRAVLSNVGELGVSAESVALAAIDALRAFLASGAPIDTLSLRHLLTPLLMAGAGSARCAPPDPITMALAEVAPRFFDLTPTLARDEGDAQRVFWLQVGEPRA